MNPFQIKATVPKKDKKTSKDITNTYYGLMGNKKTTQMNKTSAKLLINNEPEKKIKSKKTEIYPKDLSLKSAIRIFAPNEIPLSTFTNVKTKLFLFLNTKFYN